MSDPLTPLIDRSDEPSGTDDFTGTCRCGSVAYRFAARWPLANYCCHCLNCQKWTGSAFADQIVVPADAFSLSGKTASFVVTRPVGEGDSAHHFCRACHSQLYVVNTARPGAVLVRAGTLDDLMDLEPVAHIWVKRKRPWIALPADVPTFDEGPDPEAFFAIVGPLLG